MGPERESSSIPTVSTGGTRVDRTRTEALAPRQRRATSESAAALLDRPAPDDGPHATPSARAEIGAALERQLLISGTLEPSSLSPRRRVVHVALLVLGTAGLALGGAYLWLQANESRWNRQMTALNGQLEGARSAYRGLEVAHRGVEEELRDREKLLTERSSERDRLEVTARTASEDLAKARRAIASLEGEKTELQQAVARLREHRLGELAAVAARVGTGSARLFGKLFSTRRHSDEFHRLETGVGEEGTRTDSNPPAAEATEKESVVVRADGAVTQHLSSNPATAALQPNGSSATDGQTSQNANE